MNSTLDDDAKLARQLQDEEYKQQQVFEADEEEYDPTNYSTQSND